MTAYSAIVIDDLAADRQLATYALRQAGWTVYPARTTTEAHQLLRHHGSAAQLMIVTDLHMPRDPLHAANGQPGTAGSQFVIRLRAQMQRGALPRLPLFALTALTEPEIHLTALAFGCDAVLTKPATPDLAARMLVALAHTDTGDTDPVGAQALLQLLRCRFAEVLQPTAANVTLTEQDITRALLAYHRQGLVGLGQSALGSCLAPDVPSIVRRGELVYERLLVYLEETMNLSPHESIPLLVRELQKQSPPAEQCRAEGLSLSEYYRRRRDAINVLLGLLQQRYDSTFQAS